MFGRGIAAALARARAATLSNDSVFRASQGFVSRNMVRLRTLVRGTADVAQAAKATIAEASAVPEPRYGLRGLLRTYMELTKFRLGSLVVVTTTAGFIIASGNVVTDGWNFDWKRCFWVTIGTSFYVAAANSLNQIIEVPRDRIMTRTMKRPLVIGRLSLAHAITFAIGCSVAGTVILSKTTNLLTTALGLSNVGLYAFVYTPLKVVHPINTWIGAVVGGIPPMMGCAAAQRGQPSLRDLDWDAWLLFYVLFAWQITHFLSLAYFIRNDYAKAGYKMLSISNPGLCARLAVRYAVYLLPAGLIGAATKTTDWLFAVDAGALAAYMAWKGRELALTPGDAPARRLFRSSLGYLPLFLMLAAVHSTPLKNRVRSDHICTRQNASEPFPVVASPAPE